METVLDVGLIWWITVIDVPVLTSLFYLIIRVRKESEIAIHRLQENLDVRSSQLREGLSAFKLEVAKSYASLADLKEHEERIVSHLLRIELKVDQTALKTEALRRGDS